MTQRSSRGSSGSDRYPQRSSKDGRDLSCRSSSDGSFKDSCRSPVSPSVQEALEAELESLISKSSVQYLEAVLKKVKNKAVKADKATTVGKDELGNTPSDLTDFSIWRNYQGDNAAQAKFLCYRPAFAKPPLPLTLVCKALAKFKQDALQGVPEEKDMDLAEELWRQLDHHDYVNDHEEKMKSILRPLISSYLGQDVTPYYVLQGRVRADGILLENHLVRLAFQFKSQAGNSGDPDFQMLDGFLRACTLLTSSVPGYRQYALAVCLLGPRLEVWGMTVEGGKVWAEPFVESKCYGPDDYVVATARIWRGIRLFVQNYQAEPLVSPPVPWPVAMETSVRRLAEGKLVFCFVNSNGQQEVAKFPSRYCLEAHKAWLPCAPEVYGDIVDEHGVRMVRMEYLSREKGWCPAEEVVDKFKGDAAHIDKLKACIGVALDAGHSKGFVHGDLRLCNIFLRRSQEVDLDGYPKYEAKILDFDWAGKVGDVAYLRLNKEILWPPGARYGAAITKAHDLYFKDHLVEQLA